MASKYKKSKTERRSEREEIWSNSGTTFIGDVPNSPWPLALGLGEQGSMNAFIRALTKSSQEVGPS